MAGVDQGLVSLVAVVMIASVGAPADNQLHDLPPALRLPCADLARGGGWPSRAEASDSRRREAPRGALACRGESLLPPLVRRSGRRPTLLLLPDHGRSASAIRSRDRPASQGSLLA